jgi:hypothetical protein
MQNAGCLIGVCATERFIYRNFNVSMPGAGGGLSIFNGVLFDTLTGIEKDSELKINVPSLPMDLPGGTAHQDLQKDALFFSISAHLTLDLGLRLNTQYPILNTNFPYLESP